jgi:NAD-dependent SIR2 family protein deacetylase
MAAEWELRSAKRITVECKQCHRQWLWPRPYKTREYKLNPPACPDCRNAEIEELKKRVSV